MASKNTLTFSGVSVDTEDIDVTGNGQTITFVPTRTRSGLCNIGTTTAVQAKAYYEAFSQDYNRDLIYTVTFTDTTVEIEHPDNDHFDDFVDGTHNNASNITTAVTTTTQKSTIYADFAFSAASSDYCNTVHCEITFNQSVDTLVITQKKSSTGEQIEIFNDQTYYFDSKSIDLDRSYDQLNLDVSTSTNSNRIGISSPIKLEIVSIETLEATTGGQVFITANDIYQGNDDIRYAIGLQSSDADLEWYTTPLFTNLTTGEYYAYIKDGYGCQRQEAFEIFESTNQYLIPLNFFYSNKNSVRAVKRTLPSGALSASQINFLSYENPFPIKASAFEAVYSESQLASIQFKSSYPAHTVQVISECDDELAIPTTLTLTQRTDNINRNTFLEGQISYNADYGRLVVSFVPGDEYNASGSVIRQHTFNGVLPSYYTPGTELIINNQATRIQEVITVSNIEYAVTYLTDNTTETTTIESIHQALDYEVFTFNLDFNNLPELFYFQINALKNDTSIDQVYVSELVRVLSDEDFEQEKYFVTYFWNDTSDAEVNYNLKGKGVFFRHLVNVPYTEPLKRVSNAELEVEKLDSKVTKIDYKTMKVYEMTSDAVPSEVAANWLDLYNESEYIQKDGVLYTALSAEITHTGQLAQVKATLAQVVASNEFDVVANIQDINYNGFYPVVVT